MTLVNVVVIAAMVLVTLIIAKALISSQRLPHRQRGSLVNPYDVPPRKTKHGWKG